METTLMITSIAVFAILTVIAFSFMHSYKVRAQGETAKVWALNDQLEDALTELRYAKEALQDMRKPSFEERDREFVRQVALIACQTPNISIEGMVSQAYNAYTMQFQKENKTLKELMKEKVN